MTAELQDVNDSPYFEDVETEIFVEVSRTALNHLSQTTYYISHCLQSVEVGEVLRRFTAADNDLGVNAALQYSMEQIRPNGDTQVSGVKTPTLGQFTETLVLRIRSPSINIREI